MMTCIVGVIDDKKVWIGGDRQATSGTGRVWNLEEEKIFKKPNLNGEYVLLGSAGSSRGAQLLAYSSLIPGMKATQPMYEYLTIDFARAMKEALALGGNLYAHHGIEYHFNNFILGYKGRLFTFFGDMGFAEITEKYTAVGSGSPYALGSLYTTEGTDMKTKERIEIALESAQRFDAYVKGPYDIESIPKDKNPVDDMMDNILAKAQKKMDNEN